MDRTDSSRKELGDGHCFWLNDDTNPDNFQTENAILLYDEAEPLTYGCSETSLPPKSISKINVSGQSNKAIDSGSYAKFSFNGSVAPAIGVNLSEYYSLSSISNDNRKVLNKAPGNEANAQNFQNAILSKFNEFSQSSKSLHHPTEYIKNSASSERSEKVAMFNKLEDESEGLKEIYVRKSPFLITSSDSDQGWRFTGKCSEDAFSTGLSDVGEEGRSISKNNGQPKSDGRPNKLHQLTTTSIVKTIRGLSDGPRDEVANSFERNSPPQRKLSVKQFNRPCNTFVEEIKKNNLVMKEEIFSSSKVQSSISGTFLEPTKIGDNKERYAQNIPDQFLRSRNKGGDVEVYESRGVREDGKISQNKAVVAGEIPLKTEAELNRVSREGQIEINQQFENKTNIESRHMKLLTQTSNCAKNDRASVKTKCAVTINNNDKSASQMSQYPVAVGHDIKTSLTRSSRYVRLPGYPEAFGKDYGNVKELRINDGVSFESVNVFDTLSTKQSPKNQEICHIEKKIPDETGRVRHWQVRLETKDASTEFLVPIKHMLTQTSEMIPSKSLMDISIQCEPYAIDDENSSSDIKNEHREIMICDDEGVGVQLYNILGHPLSDMDGYLLKDSHGRFLVQLDNFGVPLSCTDGRTIFLEDGSDWKTTKGSLNIIHQKFKKLITKPMKCKSKTSYKMGGSTPYLGKVKTKRNRASEWSANLMKGEETDGSSLQNSVSENVNPLRKIKLKPHSTNIIRDNTSTLVAEMESIAKLRYALLEKINFIADHRIPLYKTKLGSRNESHVRKSVMRSNPNVHVHSQDWKSEPRMHIETAGSRRFSPTYCAIKSAAKRKKANQEKMKNLMKATTSRDPTGHFHQRINDLGHMENSHDSSNESVIHLRYPRADNTEDTDAESNNLSWQSRKSADSVPILPENQFMLGGKLHPINTWEGTASLNNNEPMHRWIAQRPSIENDSGDSHEF